MKTFYLFNVSVDPKGGADGIPLDTPEFEITGREQPYRFGREAECEVDKWGVSRAHFSLTLNSAGLFIVDLRSTNGTRVNGDAISPDKPVALKTGDLIKAGTQEWIITEACPLDPTLLPFPYIVSYHYRTVDEGPPLNVIRAESLAKRYAAFFKHDEPSIEVVANFMNFKSSYYVYKAVYPKKVA